MVATSYPRFPGDGVGSFMEPIAKGIAARGHEVHLVAPWHPAITRGKVEDGVWFHFFAYAPIRSLNIFGYAEAMQADAGTPLSELRVDGGASRNDTLLQFQADLMGVPVARPVVTETTALGAAYLAGLAARVWKDTDEIARQREVERVFEPRISRDQAKALRARWAKALDRAREWETA